LIVVGTLLCLGEILVGACTLLDEQAVWLAAEPAEFVVGSGVAQSGKGHVFLDMNERILAEEFL